MTIVPVHQLDMNDLQMLGNNTAEAIRLEHEALQGESGDLGWSEPVEAEPQYDN